MLPQKEVIGECDLWLGDCREIFPQIGLPDVVITDPVWPNCPPGLLIGADNPSQLFADFCACLAPGLRQMVVMLRNDSDPRFLLCIPSWLRFQQVVTCQYALPGYYGRVLGHEVAYAFGQAVQSQPGRRVVPSLSPKAQPHNRLSTLHPCSRALVHMTWLCHWFSDVGETVCDPFGGVFTTGVACVTLGRRFVGIEIEPEFWAEGCRHIETAYRQPDLFTQQAKRHATAPANTTFWRDQCP